jgi:hypothetical protein
MTDLTIICPQCKSEIPLTESLAAPLIQATRNHYENKLTEKNKEIEQRESSVRDKERLVAEEKRKLDQEVADQVAEQLKGERARINAEEVRKVSIASASEIEARDRELSDLKLVLAENGRKLAEAQKEQTDFLKKARELDDAKREFELTIEKRVQEDLAGIRAQARREVEDGVRLKLAEAEQTRASMQRTIDELQRKAEQGSQQLQGEVQELELENLLRAKFPYDTIQPVPKGEFGGDTLQLVFGPTGVKAGTILWESKRTKNFSRDWLSKLREDQRAARAEISVLISQTLPQGVETFDVVDGVWVAHPRVIVPVATVLRNTLLEVSSARLINEGQQTKAEMVYQYLTGSRFRQRIEAIVESFSCMQEDLDKERKAITKHWAKRSEQIERVMNATVGMYGDLQGIAGKSIQQIEGLEFPALAPPSTDHSVR